MKNKLEMMPRTVELEDGLVDGTEKLEKNVEKGQESKPENREVSDFEKKRERNG